MLTLALSLCACAPSGIEQNQPQTPNQQQGSPSVDQQKPQDDTSNQVPIEDSTYIPYDYKKNTAAVPSFDFKHTDISFDSSVLNGATLNMYTPQSSAFYYGDKTEKDWFLELEQLYGVKVNYTIQADNTLSQAQYIAQLSGKPMDVVSTLINSVASTLGLMQTVEFNEYLVNGQRFISSNVYHHTNRKVFSGLGNSKMLWYNTALVKDESAFDLLQKNEWTFDALTKCVGAIKNNNFIECDNWTAFANTDYSPVTGITAYDTYKLDILNDYSINSLKSYYYLFLQKPNEKQTFKNGGTAFCYTNNPDLTKGTLSFVPIPKTGQGLRDVAELCGYGLGVSKTAQNFEAAKALCLLWSARYTDARIDSLVRLTGSIDKADKYITLSESIGGLYRADSICESMFEGVQINSLLLDKKSIEDNFKPQILRAAAVLERIQ